MQGSTREAQTRTHLRNDLLNHLAQGIARSLPLILSILAGLEDVCAVLVQAVAPDVFDDLLHNVSKLRPSRSDGGSAGRVSDAHLEIVLSLKTRHRRASDCV